MNIHLRNKNSDVEYLESLNPAQREAVTAPDGPMLVIAGAGSGKTRVLTMRIAYLLSRGVKPYNILALTFTNKAAREMKERIAQIVGDDLARQLWMGTFHSVFARILRIEAAALNFTPDYTIYDTQDSKSLITSIVKSMKLDDKVYKPAAVLSAISMAKNELITPAMYANDVNITARDKAAQRSLTVNIYQEYVKACRRANALDFDDLLLYTNVLLRDHPEVLEKYQRKFTHVLVDEFQDTNRSQYLIIKRLVDKSHNICVVGDDAQSIYSFRGAKIENILKFSNDYPEYKLVKLEQNYRSTQNIVGAANSLIAKNIGQIKKTVYSHNDEGDKLKIVSTQTDTDEASYVAEDIAARMRHERLTPASFAVLYRTNAQSRAFEEQFRKCGIPYKIYGGLAFYQRKEIKDVLAYLRLSINHYDNESLKRIINYPGRGIGATTLQKIQLRAEETGRAMWEVIVSGELPQLGISAATITKISAFAAMIAEFEQSSQTLESYRFAADVVARSGIMRELSIGRNDIEGKERLENVNELLGGIQTFSDMRKATGEEDNIRRYLEEVALITDLDSDDGNDAEMVKLMTVHTSKGLEFDSVYVVGVEEDLFPSSMTHGDPIAIEEERRLFYVAITRAMNHATVSYTSSRFQYGQRKPTRPSRFIAEIDDQYTSKTATESEPFVDSFASPFVSRYRTTSNFSSPAKRNLSPITPSKSAFKATINQSQEVTMNGHTYKVGMAVEHATFGQGIVKEIDGNGINAKLIIDFKQGGIRHLLLKFARLKPLE